MNPFDALLDHVRLALGLEVPFAVRGGLPADWLDQLGRLGAACRAAAPTGFSQREVAERIGALTKPCWEAVNPAAAVWRDRLNAEAVAALADAAARVEAAMGPLRDLAHAAEVVTAEVTGPDDAAQQDADGGMRRFALAAGDENTARILDVIGREDLSGEQKMIELIRLDRRYEGKTSADWADILRVKAPAIRQYRTWKALQKRRKAAD